jgi:N-acetylmuramoyl-L-alanine amidase
MAIQVKDHRLVLDSGAVPFSPSPNHGGALTPEYLVMHYTAGTSGESSVEWFMKPEAKASAHLVIGRNARVWQLVPFNQIAWHAGVSHWANRDGLNAWSIGIELDNAGQLVRHPDGWRTQWGRPISSADVIEAAHKNGGPVTGWHTYTVEQLELAQHVAATLVAHYGLKDVVGHDDIAPHRKTDPGPAFPMTSFRAASVGRADDGAGGAGPDAYETTTNLNIRVGPGSQFDTVLGTPLPAGTRLRRLDMHGVWMRVHVDESIDGDVDIEGWVHSGFVRAAA